MYSWIYEKKNIVNDLHWKTCNYLCSNFETILLPTFEVKSMTEKSSLKPRNIGPKTTRNMLTLSHYKFKKRLLYKADVTGTNVHVCNESYTTKTCGQCGRLEKVGSKKVFKCSKCNFIIDRDYNGARNVYIKVTGELL